MKKMQNYIDIAFGVTPLRCLYMEKFFGISNEKIRFLPIGVDVKNVPKASKNTIRIKYGFEENDILIVTGGKISSKKRMDKILFAFKQLNDSYNIGSNIKLIIFGKIIDNNFETLMKKTPNTYYLEWLNRKQTLEVLKMTDIAIWNTIHTTLIEDALGSENALILRYYGSTAHFIEDNGLYLYSSSIKEIYEKLLFLVAHPNILEEMKENSKFIARLLSYKNVAKESIEYYYDSSPKFLHKYFMNEKFLDTSYEYYEKIV